MPARSLTERVEILEQKVRDLQLLPDRVAAVESHILQLRGEMRDGFSAIRERFDGIDQRFEEMEQRFDGIDRRFGGIDQRFEEMDQRFEGLDQQLKTIDERFGETHRFMRVLHEEVLTRLSLLQEGRGRRKR
jgi:chromosome segregation ATPase